MINSSHGIILAKLPNNYALVLKEEQKQGLNEKELQRVNALKQRDKDVRQHEASHIRNPEIIAVGAPKYQYAIGPDGKAYAIGGSVTVTTGRATTPEDAMRKAMALKQSAMGVAEPSAKDISAAISANYMFQEALIKRAKGPDFSSTGTLVGNELMHTKSYADHKKLAEQKNSGQSANVDFFA